MEAEQVTIKQDLTVEYNPVQILESSKCVMSKWSIKLCQGIMRKLHRSHMVARGSYAQEVCRALRV
jgi:hypothetical protein